MIQGQDVAGRNMFLSKALEKILEEKEVRRSQHLQLKKACESALEEIRNDARSIAEKNQQNSATLPLPKSMGSGDTERYFLPFELALQSKHPRFATLSLDCLQKLIAYGHFSGNKVDATNTSRRLMDRLVEVVCECFNNGRAEDAVLLQIVKLLLTIIASNHVEIHGESLLLVIRTCYNIHLFSREKVTQETASGSLVQMINRILSRMEEQPEAPPRHGSLRERSVSQLSAADSSRETLLTDSHIQLFENGERDIVDPDVLELLSNMVNSIGNEMDGPDQAEESRSVPPSPSLRPRGSSIDARSIQSVDSGDLNSSGDEPIAKQNCTIWEKDAYHVFRSLCKLSMKVFKEPADPKAVDYRSKMLSLKLIHSMLQNAGPVFRSHPVFIDGIKRYLCVSLSRNGVTSSADVFRLSLSIFLELLAKFKTHLKMQIEVFFRDIFLNILESSSTSFTNKWTMMEALTKICSDAQCVVDLYVNYDCDLTAANLFARIVSDLTKIAQGTSAVDLTITPQQAQRMRHKGYQCIVAILNCMVEWSKELYVVPHPMSNLAESERSGSEDPEKSSGQVNRNSSSPAFGVASNASIRSPGDSPSHLEERKLQKEIVEQGIDLFNKKPKRGLQFLQEHGIVGLTHTDIAAFLHKEERLDKTLVGDFLSDNTPYSRDIMHAYIDLMDFAGRDIVQGLRIFLDGFRLPGEAQKIDRLMEKFASRYCENNPDLGLFASADTAYVLAYSIIMLTTDLHSPQVKHKMTKEQYIKMNRGINDQKDLPEEYLSKIYDEIAEHEIRMKTAPPPKPKNSTTPKQRQLIYNMEMNQVAQAAKALMENVSHVQASFTSAKHSEHVKYMFKVCWTPFLAAFSLGLQDSDDAEINQFCLEGFRYAIRIACIFHMTLERDAYIQALARFTLLTASSPLSEMKAKNVDTIKTIISVAQTDGNYLGHCWLEILKCISQLEWAQVIGSGTRTSRNGNPHYTPRGATRPSVSFSTVESSSSIFGDVFRSKADIQRIALLNESMEEARSQNIVVAVDRVFASSMTLDGDAIVDFVKALCQVSMEELHWKVSADEHPRMYSLTKIVEISYYNMDRIRLQWSRIWHVLGEHFNEVGCKQDERVAIFAIDSLRQLSMTFLEKGEFAHFRFQKDFLRPFEHIMKANRSLTIRFMIVQCISHMVNSKPGSIKSGWKNIFSVLHHAAADTDPDLVEMAFRTTSKIIMQDFELYFTNIIESFQDAVKCLAEFACNMNFPDISMESIRLIRHCARYVAEKPQVFREHALDFEDKSESGERVWVKGWFPILLGLSVVVNRCKLDVRTRALTVLFEIIKTFGHSFASGWWKDLFQVLFRLFDDLKLPQNHMEKAEWMTTTCSHALFSIVDVMTQYFDTLGKLLLDDVCNQLKWCITQDNEQLARSGTNCFETLILSSGPKFDQDVWKKTCQTLAVLLKLTLPTELMDIVQTRNSHPHGQKPSENHLEDVGSVHNQLALAAVDSDDFHGKKLFGSRSVTDDPILSPVIVKCTVQLELIQAVDNIVFFPATSRKEDAECLAIAEAGKPPTMHSPSLAADSGMYAYMSSDLLFDLVRALLEVYNFCKSFDMSEEFRGRLSSQTVFKAKRTLPGLLRQEINSITCVLRILFRIHGDPARSDVSAKTEDVLLSVCREAVTYFCGLPSEIYREAWRIVLVLLFVKVMKMEDDRFRRFASVLYNDVCLLLTIVEQVELKSLLRWFFSRCGDTFRIKNPA